MVDGCVVGLVGYVYVVCGVGCVVVWVLCGWCVGDVCYVIG